MRFTKGLHNYDGNHLIIFGQLNEPTPENIYCLIIFIGILYVIIEMNAGVLRDNYY